MPLTLHYFDTETTIGGFQNVDMKLQIDPSVLCEQSSYFAIQKHYFLGMAL